MSTESTFSTVTEDMARQWHEWAVARKHNKNPFKPRGGGPNTITTQTNDKVLFVAAITATTEPDHGAVNVKQETAAIKRSLGTTVYDNGDDKPTQQSPPTDIREITLNKQMSIQVPLMTELATAGKYPFLDLAETAEGIVEREKQANGGVYPLYLEFDGEKLAVGNLETYKVRGSIDSLTVDKDNPYMLPEQKGGAAAFYDIQVLVNEEKVKPGLHTLKFGCTGKFFEYRMEYRIDVKGSSGNEQTGV